MTETIRDFAIQMHGGQMYGDKPYVTHLDQVWDVLQSYGYTDPSYERAAYVHDILEDCLLIDVETTGHPPTDITESVLLKAVGGDHRILMAARFCKDEPGHNRKARKTATYARCHKDLELWEEHGGDPVGFPDPMVHIPLAVRVKVADRIANIRNCISTDSLFFAMYSKERDTFRDALYVPMMCEPMWEEYDRLLP